MRAAIDIGTNTVLLLIGERDEHEQVRAVIDLAQITRLGEGAGASGRLSSHAIARTLEVLGEYRRIAQLHGAEIVAVATEGVRMAANPQDFLEPAAEVLGCEVRVISGDEEGALAFRSVYEDQPEPHLRVLDIGGGSTELVVGVEGEIRKRRSFQVGSVRFYERYIHSDPPTRDEVEFLEAAARTEFEALPLAPHPVLHGIAGTVTTVGALSLGLQTYERTKVDGLTLEIGTLIELRDRLAAQSVAQRIAQPILGPGRGDVIVAGATILIAALRHCGARTLVVRDRGVRFGLI